MVKALALNAKTMASSLGRNSSREAGARSQTRERRRASDSLPVDQAPVI
jgi:hypothetical protein